MNKLKKLLFKAKNALQKHVALMLIVIFVAPFFGFAGSDKIYVDDNASGKQTGSSSHPYKSLREALKHAGENDEIHVKAGVYKGNIEIPERVKIFGESRDRVIIEADDDDYETVDMNHKTELNKVTVKGGQYGVRIGKNDKASIINCVIKDSDKHGVLIETSDVLDKYKASITDSVITGHGRKGVYSAKRRLVMINNEITDNGSDGAEIEAYTSAWLDNNKFKDNDGSGLKITLDGAYIWTNDNSFKDNDREGIEINAYGGRGTIDIKDSKIRENDRWGIARVQRGYFGSSVWNGVAVQNDVEIYGNKSGSISPIIYIR